MNALAYRFRSAAFSTIALVFSAFLAATWSLGAGSAAAQDPTMPNSGSATAEHSKPATSTVVTGSATDAPGAASPSGGSTNPKSVLILDASSSMLQQDVGGSRMDAAKKATRDLIGSLPETATMGLIAYGANESDAESNREAGCKDIDVLAPIERINKQALLNKIDGLNPRGYTPMGNSLRAAAGELGKEGERSIILVSDGIDTCAPPAVCDVAKELAAQGVGLAIHTVGFKVDEAARAELQCIADAGNGEFHEAGDASSLADTLKFLAQRDAAQFEVKGTPFEYADSPDEAKWLGEGLYSTTVKADDYEGEPQPHYFKVAVPEGYDAVVTTLPVNRKFASGESKGFDNDMSSSVSVHHKEVANDSANSCESRVPLSGGEVSLSGFLPPHAARGRILADDTGTCDSAQWLVHDTVRFGDIQGTRRQLQEDVDIQVYIQFEPALDEKERSKLPKPDASATEKPEDLSMDNSTQLHGGASYLDAVEVEPGAYDDTIVPGEVLFYKMPIEWGQRPVATLRGAESVRGDLENLSLMILDPFFQELNNGRISLAPKRVADIEQKTFTIQDPVAYGNRTGDGAAEAGYYYIAVSMNGGFEGDLLGVDQPFQIAFDVQGDAIDGPEWRPSYEPGPEPADEAPEVKTSEAPAPDENSGDEQAHAAGADSSDGGLFGGLRGALLGGGLVLGGLVVLGGIAAVMYALTRRR